MAVMATRKNSTTKTATITIVFFTFTPPF